VKGILMTPDMIQAIVDGRKTVTRRLGGLEEINQEPSSWQCHMLPIGVLARQKRTSYADAFYYVQYPNIKPRYHAGETVYIKEAWCPLIPPVYNLLDPTIPTVYKQEMDAGGAILPKEFKWRSPLFMPEWAARHFITITDVRAERLQGITSADCLAEGISASDKDGIGIRGIELDYKFGQLWNSINKDYPFESNPWVWVYTFRLKGEK